MPSIPKIPSAVKLSPKEMMGMGYSAGLDIIIDKLLNYFTYLKSAQEKIKIAQPVAQIANFAKEYHLQPQALYQMQKAALANGGSEEEILPFWRKLQKMIDYKPADIKKIQSFLPKNIHLATQKGDINGNLFADLQKAYQKGQISTPHLQKALEGLSVSRDSGLYKMVTSQTPISDQLSHFKNQTPDAELFAATQRKLPFLTDEKSQDDLKNLKNIQKSFQEMNEEMVLALQNLIDTLMGYPNLLKKPPNDQNPPDDKKPPSEPKDPPPSASAPVTENAPVTHNKPISPDAEHDAAYYQEALRDFFIFFGFTTAAGAITAATHRISFSEKDKGVLTDATLYSQPPSFYGGGQNSRFVSPAIQKMMYMSRLVSSQDNNQGGVHFEDGVYRTPSGGLIPVNVRFGDININNPETDDPFDFAERVTEVITHELQQLSASLSPFF